MVEIENVPVFEAAVALLVALKKEKEKSQKNVAFYMIACYKTIRSLELVLTLNELNALRKMVKP